MCLADFVSICVQEEPKAKAHKPEEQPDLQPEEQPEVEPDHRQEDSAENQAAQLGAHGDNEEG